MAGRFEQLAGVALVLFTVLDIFLTVLYAKIGSRGASRAGAGIVSLRVARAVWWVFRKLTLRLPVQRDAAWSFCGATTVVILVIVWSAMLAFGTGLMIHPVLGDGVRSSSSPHAQDFLAALYAGGTSLSLTSGSDFYPQTGWYRLMYLVNALIGTASISVTITYILQLYNAVLQRNALGLGMHLMTRRSGDAAVLIAGLGPQGRFDTGYSVVADLGAELAAINEAHKLFPLLFFYRPYHISDSIPQIALVALDAATLVRTALDDDEYRWLKESAALENLGGLARVLVDTLGSTFIPGAEANTDGEREQAGIRVSPDPDEGSLQYARLRMEWDPQIRRLAGYMDYDMAAIDRATHAAQTKARSC